ncbi:hypothetical protein U1Q18_041371 [Sarracenia purpurea var. burkii]
MSPIFWSFAPPIGDPSSFLDFLAGDIAGVTIQRFGFPDLTSGLHKVRIPRPYLWSAQGSDSPTLPLVLPSTGLAGPGDQVCDLSSPPNVACDLGFD